VSHTTGLSNDASTTSSIPSSGSYAGYICPGVDGGNKDPTKLGIYYNGYTYIDAIILLSDGLNTLDRWYGNGSTTNTSVDARMYDSGGNGTCANIKAVGITIYTVQVNTGGDPTSLLLKNCASTSDKFYLLTSASQIIDAFTKIGTNLSQLRVAR
jgi:hypothetical protein